MVIKQWTKLVVCALVLICSTALMMCNKVDSTGGVAMITAVLGYVFGNGHAIAENRTKSNTSSTGGN